MILSYEKCPFFHQQQKLIWNLSATISHWKARAAVSFIAELRMQCHKIAAMPFAYSLRSEIAEGSQSCPHGNCDFRSTS